MLQPGCISVFPERHELAPQATRVVAAQTFPGADRTATPVCSCLGGIRPARCAEPQIYRLAALRLPYWISSTCAASNTATLRQGRAASHIHLPESLPAWPPLHASPKTLLPFALFPPLILKAEILRKFSSGNKPAVYGALTLAPQNPPG